MGGLIAARLNSFSSNFVFQSYFAGIKQSWEALADDVFANSCPRNFNLLIVLGLVEATSL